FPKRRRPGRTGHTLSSPLTVGRPPDPSKSIFWSWPALVDLSSFASRRRRHDILWNRPDQPDVTHRLGGAGPGTGTGIRAPRRAAAHAGAGAVLSESYAGLRRRCAWSAAGPAELGGGGASHAEMCEMLRPLAHGCSSTALALSMHPHQILTPAWRWRHEGAP